MSHKITSITILPCTNGKTVRIMYLDRELEYNNDKRHKDTETVFYTIDEKICQDFVTQKVREMKCR